MRIAGLTILLLGLAAACGSPRQGSEAVPENKEQARPASESANHPRRAECVLAEAGCHNADACNGICEPALPTSDYGCGIPPNRVESCKADSDCKAQEVCNAFSFGCDMGHRCEARCETAGCADGWTCRSDGRCSALVCPNEWSCADYGECRPPLPGEGPLQYGRDWHGCVPLSCKSDAECPCAHCVNSSCTLIPGRCIQPRG